MGVERLLGSPDAPDDVKKVFHSDAGGGHGTVAAQDMAFSSGADNGIVTFGDHGGEEESFAQPCIAELRHTRFAVDRRARSVLSGVDARVSDQLSGVLEERDVLDFGDKKTGSLVGNALDRYQQVVQLRELRVLFDMLLNQ